MSAYFFNLYQFGVYEHQAVVITDSEADAYTQIEKTFPKMTANLFCTISGKYFINGLN